MNKKASNPQPLKPKIVSGEKYLVTTDSWFYAPDGNTYRAAWGELSFIEDDFLGIKTNKGSTNWYLQVGYEEKSVIIAGCQVHYAVRSDKKPSLSGTKNHWCADAKRINLYSTPNAIWIAEDE